MHPLINGNFQIISKRHFLQDEFGSIMNNGACVGGVDVGPAGAPLNAGKATAVVVRDVREWRQELVKAYSIHFACGLLWKDAKIIVDAEATQGTEEHGEKEGLEERSAQLVMLIKYAKVQVDRIRIDHHTKFRFHKLWERLGDFFEVTCALRKEEVRRLVVLNPKFLHVFLSPVPYRLHTRVPWGFLLSHSDSWLGAPAHDALIKDRKALLEVYSWNQWASLLGVMYKLVHSQVIDSHMQLESQLNPCYSRDIDQDVLTARNLSPDFLAMVRSKGCLPDLLNRWWDKGAPDAYMTLGGPVVVAGPADHLTVGDIVSCTTLVVSVDVSRPSSVATPLQSGNMSYQTVLVHDGETNPMGLHLACVQYMKNMALLFNVISDEGVSLAERSELSINLMVPSAQFYNFADARNHRVYLHLLEKMLQLIKLMEDNQLSRVGIRAQP